MKLKTTKREILSSSLAVSIGYCDAYHLLRLVEPVAYTKGTYGWNADVYYLTHDGFTFALVTGYRPFGNVYSARVKALVHKYEEEAKKLDVWADDYRNRAYSLLEDFCGSAVQAIKEYLANPSDGDDDRF